MHELAQYQDEGNDQWTPWPGLVWDDHDGLGDLGDRGDQDNGDLGDCGDQAYSSYDIDIDIDASPAQVASTGLGCAREAVSLAEHVPNQLVEISESFLYIIEHGRVGYDLELCVANGLMHIDRLLQQEGVTWSFDLPLSDH